MKKQWKQWETLFSWAPKSLQMVTAAMKLKDASSLEEKLWPVIALTCSDSILKSRDITLPTKVHLVKATVFPVVMYGCDSWTIKKAEHRRIDAFEVWCWRRLLRVPWTARRSNQSILKEISPEYSLEGLMLKLKLQYSGHLMQRTDLLEKTLMLGKIEGRRRRGWQKMRWMASLTRWTWVWASSESWWWTGKPGVLQSMGLQRAGHNWATELGENLLWWRVYCYILFRLRSNYFSFRRFNEHISFFICLYVILLLAVLGLRSAHSLFSSCGERGLLSNCSVQVSCCSSFSSQSTGSRCVSFSSCGAWVYSATCGVFPGLGIESMSPVLQGRFLITGPPGKPLFLF